MFFYTYVHRSDLLKSNLSITVQIAITYHTEVEGGQLLVSLAASRATPSLPTNDTIRRVIPFYPVAAIVSMTT